MRIDLHVHSTASDGEHAPAEVVRHAVKAGLGCIALTDHDTVAGVPEARTAGESAGVRVVAGCEFSVAGPGGEMHLLAYFLPLGDAAIESFLSGQRANRMTRAQEIIRRLGHAGVRVSVEQVEAIAGGGSWGRPHVAKAIVAAGGAKSVQEAFDRFIGFGRPAFVPKQLPSLEQVTSLVRSVAGVTSAAHLKDRGVRPVLQQLQKAGVDGVEVMHSAHDAHTTTRIDRLAGELGLLRSGGTDWHGEAAVDRQHAALGSLPVPPDWLTAIEGLHRSRERQEAGT